MGHLVSSPPALRQSGNTIFYDKDQKSRQKKIRDNGFNNADDKYFDPPPGGNCVKLQSRLHNAHNKGEADKDSREKGTGMFF